MKGNKIILAQPLYIGGSMKKKHRFLVLIFLLPVFILGQGSLKTARISFAEKEYDFKTIAQGTVAEHVFHFKNIGQDTLKILKVRPG